MRRTHRKVWCSGSCWTKNCGTSLTALRTKDSLKKSSISPSGSIIPNTGGQGRADEKPSKLPAAQPQPKKPQDNLGPCWPEAVKEVYQNGLCASTKRPFQNQDKAGLQPNEAPACLFFQRSGGGPPGLPVFPWQYREQCRHVPDDRPHAPVLLSGYV